MSSELTTTSYLVLGLLAAMGPSTSYELKRGVNASIGHFWPFPHSQLYSVPLELVEMGLVKQEQEMEGRRRRWFTITPEGRRALRAWLHSPTETSTEIRDLGLLKLFFGAIAGPEQMSALAKEQRRLHSEQLEEYRRMHSEWHEGVTRTPSQATLRMGLLFEESAVSFWSWVEEQIPNWHQSDPGDEARTGEELLP